jgi:penicillin-binding protein 1A
MSDPERTIRPPTAVPADGEAAVVPLHGPRDGDGTGNGAPPPATSDEPPGRRRVRIRKLRVFALLAGLGALAAVSTVFGMMMAVASDLPALEEPAFRNSILLDRKGHEIGLLTGNQKRLFLSESQIAPVMKHAIIAIEDRRFYTNEGVDLRGIGRALYQDVLSKRVVQGGSTITQQFVKNALAAQDNRTLFVKLREAALAYHLTRKWSKERILRNYLNTIYFGNGAYGIGSAAQTYFATDHPGCEQDKARPCAAQLEPQEAALLAGMVASPGGFDPIAHPAAARQRRDLVLQRMLEQGFLTREQYDDARSRALPTRTDIQPPAEDTRYPYFTSWIKQQVVDRLGGGQTGARRAFEGGLRVRTTIDSDLQDAATAAVNQWLPNPDGPRASIVAIHNRTGEVRAMVGGDDYEQAPFNLATQGQRQPGSSFKPFVLAEALRQGIGPGSVWTSKKKVFVLKGGERFTVNNYENAYSGVTTLERATTFSDNSVYAEVGMKVGPRRIARMARRMGIRTPVSSNYANALGGLHEGVTPLDMAHAYETFAQGGKLTYGTLSPGKLHHGTRRPVPGPVGIDVIGRGRGKDFEPVELPNGQKAQNRVRTKQVIDPGVASTVQSMLEDVVRVGTATRAQVPNLVIAGKTGTTENYGDAWFVGWTPDYTIAVWVGYPDKLVPMRTEFNGEPVAGGTYPAGIFKTFVESILRLHPPKTPTDELPVAPDAPAPGTAAPATPTPAPTQQAPAGDGDTGGGTTPEAPTPQPPQPTATPQPDSGGGATPGGGQPTPAPGAGTGKAPAASPGAGTGKAPAAGTP